MWAHLLSGCNNINSFLDFFHLKEGGYFRPLFTLTEAGSKLLKRQHLTVLITVASVVLQEIHCFFESSVHHSRFQIPLYKQYTASNLTVYLDVRLKAPPPVQLRFI